MNKKVIQSCESMYAFIVVASLTLILLGAMVLGPQQHTAVAKPNFGTGKLGEHCNFLWELIQSLSGKKAKVGLTEKEQKDLDSANSDYGKDCYPTFGYLIGGGSGSVLKGGGVLEQPPKPSVKDNAKIPRGGGVLEQQPSTDQGTSGGNSVNNSK